MSVIIDGSAGVTYPVVAGGTSAIQASSSKVLQVVNVQSGAVATGTTTIPNDDTIPQITEGTEFLTLAITPSSATSKLKIDVIIFLAHSISAASIITALFQDSTANALSVATNQDPNPGGMMPMCITYYMTAGTTSSTTFRVRGGSDSAGTITFNGNSSARKFGGVFGSNITIMEIAA